jgi:hypothetical protein
MVSWNVYNLCCGDRTVSSELADDSKRAPYKVFKELYEDTRKTEKHADQANVTSDEQSEYLEDQELKKAAECGKWGGAVPSRLFLKVQIISVFRKSPFDHDSTRASTNRDIDLP